MNNDDDFDPDAMIAQLHHYDTLRDLMEGERHLIANLSCFLYPQFKGADEEKRILATVLRAVFNCGYEAGRGEGPIQ